MRSTRAEFSKATREEAWARCFDKQADDGRCEGLCKELFAGRVPEYHHLIPAALGGDNSLTNCAVLCKKCHKHATKEETAPMVSRAKRIEEKRAGLRKPKYQWPKRKLNAFQRGA